MRARSRGCLSGKVLEVGPSQHKAQSRGEWKRDLPSRAKKTFPSREQYSHLRRPGTGSNIK